MFTVVLVMGPTVAPNLQEKKLRLRVAQQGCKPLSVTLTLNFGPCQREACSVYT